MNLPVHCRPPTRLTVISQARIRCPIVRATKRRTTFFPTPAASIAGYSTRVKNLKKAVKKQKARDNAMSVWSIESSSGGFFLANFLGEVKTEYLKDVGQSRAEGWTVVMGNEAGDLDSVASALAYAWYKSHDNSASKIVPLIQSTHADLHLRTENIHALSLAGIDTQRVLLCMDDIPLTDPFPSNKFVLVDHNRLLPKFTKTEPEAQVVAVIDHHADEGLYQETADPRIIVVPTGSCTSLVTRLIKESPASDQLPPELATLLLCGILIDTSGLKPGGKAVPIDREAAAYLAPLCNLSWSTDSLVSLTEPEALHEIQALHDLTEVLNKKKRSVTHLSSRNLLRRDYKEQNLTTSAQHPIRVGYSTVPISLKEQIPKDPQFWSAAEAWMNERTLDVLGILTTYKNLKNKHKREMVFLVKETAPLSPEKLWAGLEAAKELELIKKPLSKFHIDDKRRISDQCHAMLWQQLNASPSRKEVMPLVKRIIETKEAKT